MKRQSPGQSSRGFDVLRMSAYFRLIVPFKGRLCEEPPTRMV